MLTPRRMTTERLLLRLPEDSDLDPLAALYNDPGALKNIGTEAHWSREQTLRILRESAAEYEQRGYAMYTVVRRSDGAVLGLCGLCPDEDDLPEIAGVLIRRHWGPGLLPRGGRGRADPGAGRSRTCDPYRTCGSRPSRSRLRGEDGHVRAWVRLREGSSVPLQRQAHALLPLVVAGCRCGVGTAAVKSPTRAAYGRYSALLLISDAAAVLPSAALEPCLRM